MIPAILYIVLLLAPEELDELEALQTVVRHAMRTIGPSVVTVETVGGIRQINVPDRLKEKMTLPERPREGDPNAPKEEEGEEEVPPEGRTPRFKDEWRKMLAFPGFKKAEGPTTGVILSEDGYIVTSAWNFESKPNVVTVTTADGTIHAARLKGIDRAAGLALLKIDGEKLPVPRFLDPERARVGSWAFAIGRGLARHSIDVKYGVISAKNRIEGNALQTDAATSPTNYGGPLVDAEGRVFGIVVPLGARGQEANPNWYDSGIGFAAPIAQPGELIRRLDKSVDDGITELFPAFLGVETDQNRTEPGARVTNVLPDHAALKAGLEKEDVVLEIDGKKLDNPFTLRFEIGRRRAGDTVKLKVQRGAETLDIEAKLGKRPKPKARPDKMPVPMPGNRKRGRGGDGRGPGGGG